MAKISRSEFAASIKAKYPQYAKVDDETLVDKMLAKYPQYQEKVESAADAGPGGEFVVEPMVGAGQQADVAREPWERDGARREGVAIIPRDAPSDYKPDAADKVLSVLAPRSMSLPQSAGMFRKGAAAVGDVVSLPGRVAASVPSFVPGGETPAQAIQRTRGKEGTGLKGLASTVLRSPGTAIGGQLSAPLRGLAGNLLGRGATTIGGKVATNVIEGLGYTAGGQMERVAEGRGLSAGEAGVDIGMDIVVPFLGMGLNKGMKALQEELLKRGYKPGQVTQAAQELWSKAKRRLTEQKLTPEQETVNAAADRAGIPLTRAQRGASVETNQPGGFSGMMERFAGKVPGGRGIMQRHKEKVADAVKKEAQEIRGGSMLVPSGSGPEEAVQEGLRRRLEEMDTRFGEFYQLIEKQGSVARISGRDVAPELRRRINAEFPLFDDLKSGKTIELNEVTSGLPKKVANDVSMYIRQIENLDKVIAGKNYKTFRNLKQEIGNKSAEYFARMDDKAAAARAGHALDILYDGMQQIEEAHIYKVAGKRGLDSLRAVNKYFADTKNLRDFTEKSIGYHKDVSERGFKTAGEAMDTLLQPKKMEALDKVLKLMDTDTRLHLRAGMLSKLFDNSMNYAQGELSITKLSNWFEKFSRGNNRAVMERVLGAGTVDRLGDLIDGARRAGYSSVKFADASNPSGTAASWVEAVLLGGGSIGALLNPKIAAAMAAPVYLARVFGKVATGEPFSAVERGLARTGAGAAAGVAVAAATADEGDGTDRLAQGAAMGALGGLGMPYAGRLLRRGGDAFGGAKLLPGPKRGPLLPSMGAPVTQDINRVVRNAKRVNMKKLEQRAVEKFGKPQPPARPLPGAGGPPPADPSDPLLQLPRSKRAARAMDELSVERVDGLPPEARTGYNPEDAVDYDTYMMRQADEVKEAGMAEVQQRLGYDLRNEFGLRAREIDMSKLGAKMQTRLGKLAEKVNALRENDYAKWQAEYGSRGYPDDTIYADDLVELMNKGPRSKQEAQGLRKWLGNERGEIGAAVPMMAGTALAGAGVLAGARVAQKRQEERRRKRRR